MVIEPGVPLFDYLEGWDTIWVYYPRKRHARGWLCDLMILSNGELREARAGVAFSDRFLSGLVGEVPPR